MKGGFLDKSVASAKSVALEKNQIQIPQIVPTGYELVSLEVSKCEPDPLQPRKIWPDDKLAELADSIEATGGCVIPVKARINPDKPGYFYVVFGEGRWRSHIIKEIPYIRALIPVEEMDMKDVRVEQVIENVVRVPMSRLEEANAYIALMNEYKLDRKDLKKLVAASDAKLSRLFKIAAATHKVKELDAYTSSYNLLAGMADLELILVDDEFNKLCQRVKDKDINEKEVQKIISSHRKEREKFGLFNPQDPFQKALFEMLDRFNLTKDVSKEQIEEAAEKLSEVVTEYIEIGYKKNDLLTLFVIHSKEDEAIKTILNKRLLRQLFEKIMDEKTKSDQLSPHYKAVAVIANGELDEEELEEAEDALKRVCYDYGIEDPQDLVTKDWTVDNLQQESLMRALAEELKTNETKNKASQESQAEKQIISVSEFSFNDDGTLVLTSGNGKTLIMVSASMLKAIVKGAK
uniref:Chromosome (Plasmid) partitioning protein ParB n=1 Tax=Vibrio sp. FF_291 TaxID=1652832 RepID=A0A0H3ZMV4_9VIBR|nr:Chromosome (plasmid) partitioning protein ParB [Vibrio sp. FF_291]